MNSLTCKLSHGDRVASVAWNTAFTQALIFTVHGTMFELRWDRIEGCWRLNEQTIKDKA